MERFVSVELQIASGQDDASEYYTGTVRTAENSLKLGRNYLLAFRFPGVSIPNGALITSAALKMYVAGDQANSIKIRYMGERTDNSAPFTQTTHSLSNRSKTSNFLDDVPSPWTVGAFNASPDLRAIIQEIVGQSGWISGNSLGLFATDNGSASTRKIGSVETLPSFTKAAILVVTYQVL